MKVLITGGAGFIGLHLARRLASKNHDITILDNFARSSEDLDFIETIEKHSIVCVKGDITTKRVFDELDSYDYVYHLAAINGTDNFYRIPDKVLKVGVVGTINVLDWFVESQKGKLLFSSSSEAYAGALKILGSRFPVPTPENVPLVVDDPSNVRWSYGAGKIAGEVAMHAYAHVYGIKRFCIIRYHNIYGPRMGFDHVIPQLIGRIAKKEDPFRIFGGEETRTFCYVDDAVAATQLVMENESTNGQTVHIGRSDGEIKIIDLAKKLFDISGFHPSLDIQPAPKGSVQRRCPDTTKLSGLGFAANVSLEEGLKRTFAWYKDKFSVK